MFEFGQTMICMVTALFLNMLVQKKFSARALTVAVVIVRAFAVVTLYMFVLEIAAILKSRYRTSLGSALIRPSLISFGLGILSAFSKIMLLSLSAHPFCWCMCGALYNTKYEVG